MAPVTVDVVDPLTRTTYPITGSRDDFGVIGALQRTGGHYEPHVLTALGRALRPDSVCLDIGANIGVVTVFLARHCPAGSVHAFEPSATTFSYLATNVAANRLTNVITHQLGVYDRTTTLHLSVHPTHPGGAFVSETDIREGTGETISVVALDEWLPAVGIDRVDVVKIDVEGAELRALRGAENLLRRHRPVLIVECNPLPLRRFQNATAADMIDLLHEIYGPIAFLDPTGGIHTLESLEQALDELGHQGILELVCGAGSGPRTTRLAAWRARLRRHRPPLRPRSIYVHSPSYVTAFDVERIDGPPGATISITVHLENTSAFWWDSGYEYHPVRASYRWLSTAGTVIVGDGLRTTFTRPIAPGESVTLDLAVEMPAEAGDYVFEFCLVQESYAWFDQLDAALAVRLPARAR
ncbi:MAG: FkbM family methyltransferase [Acidimicrobiales bacterium]